LYGIFFLYKKNQLCYDSVLQSTGADMKIKKISIHGFKSFVDKVTLHFPAGTSGIIGPNGCGKSNIVDAIRWVLGEQNARHLRGKHMEDIIFNGSENRKPLGMAEVVLTFSNEDGLASARFANFTENRAGAGRLAHQRQGRRAQGHLRRGGRDKQVQAQEGRRLKKARVNEREPHQGQRHHKRGQKAAQLA